MKKRWGWRIDAAGVCMLSALQALLVMWALFTAPGCSSAKPILRTVNDHARAICELRAKQNPDRTAGLSPEEWCALRDNIDPFIREIDAATTAAAEEAGLVGPHAGD